jgi:4-hydroxymandelate oxidase
LALSKIGYRTPFGSRNAQITPVARYAATGTPVVSLRRRAAVGAAPTALAIHEATRIGSAAATTTVPLMLSRMTAPTLPGREPRGAGALTVATDIPDAPQLDSTHPDAPTILRHMSLVNLADYEAAARKAVAGSNLDYYDGGSNDELTLRDNVAAFSRITVFPRMFRGVGTREMSTTVVGASARWPVIVAPIALLGMLSPEGEVPAVRAATAAGSIFVLSSVSVTPIEDVMAAATGPVWFQLYVYKDRAASEALVKRVEESGCSALELTADVPIVGRRERDVRNSFALPEGLWTPNLTADAGSPLPETRSDSPFKAAIDALFDPTLTWDDVGWLTSITTLPVLVKGILRADDAVRAVDAGAAGVIVSNHGGRQLDTAPAAIDALAAIVDAVGDRTEVIVDGGIRRGVDVVKAIALGARAVQIGRPIVWGLVVDGEEGISDVPDSPTRRVRRGDGALRVPLGE